MLVVLPGATMMGGVRAGFGSASTLTVSDAEALHREDPAVGQVGYLIRQAGQVQYGNTNWTTNVQGVTPSYGEIAGWHVFVGRCRSEPVVGGEPELSAVAQSLRLEVKQQVSTSHESHSIFHRCMSRHVRYTST
jgi:hypothetical protein